MKLKNLLLKRPYSISLYITNRCNSKCTICNFWKQKPKIDMKASDLNKIIQKSKLLKNAFQYNISGGEPFTSKELIGIVDNIMKINPYRIHIATNGLSDNIVPIMKELSDKYGKNKFGIKVSLDGFHDTYYKIRGVNGFYKVTDTIDKLIKNRFKVSVGFTMQKENEDDFIWIHYMYGKRVLCHPLDNIRSYDKVNKRFYKSPFIFHRKPVFFLYNLFLQKTLKQKKRIHKCMVGTVSLIINPNLDVYTCNTYPIKFGNLKDYDLDFDKLWYENIERVQKSINKSSCYCFCTGDIIPSLIRNWKWLR